MWVGIIPWGAMLFCLSPISFAADLISGTVRNGTSGQPATGDDVVLLRLDRSPHEEARTKIDAHGGFSFDLPDAGHPHIVRVTHQGVNYDKPITAGGAISIDVFDATAKAQGVTGSIEIIRAGTRGSALHVSDMIEIRNASNPPVTQAGARSFEVYLPAAATIDSVLAAGPENITTSISATPVAGDPGHYAVNFPVVPGATKFAFNYDLPYEGHAKFRARTIYPFQQLAVMIPPTMTFASRSSAFQPLPVGADRYHVEAVENVKAGTGLEFEISGSGELPAAQVQSHATSNPPVAPAKAPATAISQDTPQTPSAVPIAAPDPKIAAGTSTAWWWVLGAATGLGLAAWILLVWRYQHMRDPARSVGAQPHAPALQSEIHLVDALKEGLLQLESDRVQGIIRVEDYASAKHAMEGTIRWALSRAQNGKANTAAS
jgi:cell division septation protein DedD